MTANGVLVFLLRRKRQQVAQQPVVFPRESHLRRRHFSSMARTRFGKDQREKFCKARARKKRASCDQGHPVQIGREMINCSDTET